MLAPLALLALAASPAPRVLPDADVALDVPSLTAAKPELSFFSRAGQRSAVLDPRSWSADLHPLVPLDVTRPESFTAAGLDPNGPSSWSARGDLKLTCSALADAQRFTQLADARLKTLGEPWIAKAESAELRGAQVAGQVEVGYVIAAHTECTASGPGAERTLRYAARWLTSRWPSTPNVRGLSGRVFAISPQAVAGLSGTADTLKVDGRGDRRIALEATHLPTYPLPSSGLFRARGTFLPAALAHSARQALALRCVPCSRPHLDALERALAEGLTGEALVRVDRFEPVGGLSTTAGQFTAMRLASVARVKNSAPIRAALDALGSREGSGPPDRWRLPMRGGSLELGLSRDALYVANDPTARDRALAAATSRAPPSHALEFAVDPSLIASGLGRISLLDAISDRQLAGAFAFATEAVPVLRGTRALSGWADPAGSSLRFGGSWTLTEPASR